MNDQTKQDADTPQLDLPQQLAADLRALHGTRVLVPREVDEAVMAQARERLSRKRRAWVGWSAASAAVAVIAIAVGVSVFTGASFAREDVDRNGQVDILDAFALARQLESPAGPSAAWDMTGDGVVDKKDVAHIACAAVKLDKEAL